MKEVPIWEKSNLSLEEAAAYSSIGINKLRDLTNWPGGRDRQCGQQLPPSTHRRCACRRGGGSRQLSRTRVECFPDLLQRRAAAGAVYAGLPCGLDAGGHAYAAVPARLISWFVYK